MKSKLTKFLQNNISPGNFYTHTSIFDPRGKLLIKTKDKEEFWDLYCSHVEKGYKCSVTESPQIYTQFILDVDLKEKTKKDVADELKSSSQSEDGKKKSVTKLYTTSQVKSLLKIVIKLFKTFLESYEEKDFTSVLLAKKSYFTEDKLGNIYRKNGFHIHFPYLFLNSSEVKTQFLPKVISEVYKENVFGNIELEDVKKIIDAGIFTNPCLIYGSSKAPTLKSYKIDKVFKADLNQMEITDFLLNYKIYRITGEEIEKGVDNCKFYIPRILSIIPCHRKTTEFKNVIKKNSLLEMSRKQQLVIEEYEGEDIKIKESEIEKYLNLVNPVRSESYSEWINMGWILYSITNGSDYGLKLWIRFSSQSPENFDDQVCIQFWSKMYKGRYTINSLKRLAQIDNPIKFSNMLEKKTKSYLENSIYSSATHVDVAEVLYMLYCNKFVCTNIKSKTWYEFIGPHWEETEEGNELRKKISTVIAQKYKKILNSIYQSLINIDDENEDESVSSDGEGEGKGKKKEMNKELELRRKTINKIIDNLKNSTFKNNVMRECSEKFYSKRFEDKLDTNPNIIAFKNGVYDFENNIFRKGTPEDYIKTVLPIEYKIYQDNDPEVEELELYLQKVFTDRSLRRFFLDYYSEIFIGGNKSKKVVFWTNNDGNNAKSVTRDIFQCMLGKLSITMPTTLVSGKKPASGTPWPELARSKGARAAWIDEPSPDEQFNGSILKNLSGNDYIAIRDLFERGKDMKEVKPLFKMTVIVNELPPFRSADMVSGSSKPIWNRIYVLPFESTFIIKEEDYHLIPPTFEEQLQKKIFKADTEMDKKLPKLAEVFAWYLLRHRATYPKAPVPEKVKIATKIYEKENDILAQFEDENIERDEKSMLSLVELYECYKGWYSDSISERGCPPKNKIKDIFSKRWGEPTRNSWSGYKLKNLAILSDNSDDDDEDTYIPLS